MPRPSVPRYRAALVDTPIPCGMMASQMDLTNRAIIITGALIWIFVALLILLLAWSAPDKSIDRLADFANYLNKHNTTGAQLVVTFGGLIFALLGAMLIIFELA